MNELVPPPSSSTPNNSLTGSERPEAPVLGAAAETDLAGAQPSFAESGPEQQMQDDRELQLFVGAGTSVEGRISFTGIVRVEGQFEGELLGGEALIIAGRAQVSGLVSAREVLVLGGQVSADIVAEDLVELHEGCEVSGNIESLRIDIARGARFTGRSVCRPLSNR